MKNKIQNDNMKCGLTEENTGHFVDEISINAYVWYDKNWQHDDYEHKHERYQLTYVEEGYQYFHIDNKILLVPQNHLIWIPSGKAHKISSEAKTVNLMIALFKSVPKNDFYNHIHVFPAPNVLKEMILYASKWSQLITENEEQSTFLTAILNSLPSFCDENNSLQIPVPADNRLIPVCNYINSNYHDGFGIDELAELAHLSVRSLQRIFKHETGITIQKYMQLIRVLKSIELINDNQNTLSEIAYKVGYKSLSAFTTSYFTIMKSKPKLKK